MATGGLTRLYARNSASANMGGDGYALALRAGASLVDMEFVQFFPIGHLAPRLIGMDPIMWDPFRYKLGGRLLNGRMEEFTSQYGSDEDGKYVLTRDLASYAILKEVEAGRGSPHGGAYLSFQHCSEAALREAFGPVIDRLAANNIDLTRRRSKWRQSRTTTWAASWRTHVWQPNCLDYSLPARRSAAPTGRTDCPATPSPRRWCLAAAPAVAPRCTLDRSSATGRSAGGPRYARPHRRRAQARHQHRGDGAAVQATMQDDVGTLRREDKLMRALNAAGAIGQRSRRMPARRSDVFDLQRLEWFDLRNMLLVARTVAQAALARRESRGAHQREDFPDTKPAWESTRWRAARRPHRLSGARQRTAAAQ